MKIAVIGSNSFLAKEIIKSTYFYDVDFILYGIQNEGLSDNFTYFKYPEAQLDFKDLLKIDAIIYCSGAGIQSNLNEPIELLFELNSFLPIRLFNYLNCNGYKGKIMTFGSYYEIGENNNLVKYDENMILKSDNKVSLDYTQTKRVLSNYLYNKQLSFDFYHLFLPTIYNKAENPLRLIPYVINRLQNNLDLEFTKGEQIRQYLHTDDLVGFINLLLSSNDFEPGFYNVAPDEFYTIKELVKLIFEILEKPFIEDYFGRKDGRDDSMKVLCMNNNKMKSTGFTPSINLKSGIKFYLNPIK